MTVGTPCTNALPTMPIPPWQTTAAHWGRRQQDLGPRQVRRHLVQLVEALLASVEE
jgi:hypothetical protein